MSTQIFLPSDNNNEGCIPKLNFKPGSIGPKVSFLKTPSTPVDVIIPGKLEITRGNNGGIYNSATEGGFNQTQSPQYTRWNTQYVDPENTNWSSLTDIENRTYVLWKVAITTPSGYSAPPMYVGMQSIMKYDDGSTVKYYLIVFTKWQANGGGAFGYDRYEILDGVVVDQPSSDTIGAQVIDIVSNEVHLTRSYQGNGLYNSAIEGYSQPGLSPFNTRWNSVFTDSRAGYSGFGNLENLESRVYTDFYDALNGNVDANLPATKLIMHDLTTDIYHKVEFNSWADDCGGPGSIQYNSSYTNPTGYPEGIIYVQGTGGSGSGIVMQINTDSSGNMLGFGVTQSGTGYQPGDTVQFIFNGSGNLIINIVSVCYQGGFNYTRTPIPQSCGIKLADGTVINSAYSLGVQTVTGLNTDNTDPANPIVQISVDGTTITGDGTPSNPLVAVPQCRPEYTKIASHSHNIVAGSIEGELKMLFGGTPESTDFGTYPIWSMPIYKYKFPFATPFIKASEKALGIPCPINLIQNDILTISGTAFFNNIGPYNDFGYTSSFLICVSVFDCSKSVDGNYESFTVIPVQTYLFEKDGSVCFSASIKLSSNYDYHTTRFLIGASATAVCPTNDCTPPQDISANIVAVTYTLDVERPCFTPLDNYIIKNCCEPLITELVHAPNYLTVGAVYVDDEGNCWEVMSESKDVTNFTRNFVNTYDTCVKCQQENGCPSNLIIKSCCVPGEEYVTGSLPGLAVGDTFVDNNGLCWFVESETGAPISEESITVSSIIMGNCDTCLSSNPCPNLYKVESCCGKVRAVISTTTVLNDLDAFVDQNGICWQYIGLAGQLPTNYDIDVVTVYPGDSGSGNNGCNDCITVNPCPEDYFLTIRSCCDPDRVEIINVPANSMNFGEGVIISDTWKLCWEVMAISTTGTATYDFWDWNNNPFVPAFGDCFNCIANVSNYDCLGSYQVINCNTNETFVAITPFLIPVLGQWYIDGKNGQCYQVTGYGYPLFDEPVKFVMFDGSVFTSCEDCILRSSNPKVVSLINCCDNTPVVATVNQPFQLGTGYTYYLYEPNQDFYSCYTLVGLNTVDTPTQFFEIQGQYVDCTQCTDATNPC
jgi:hypothetical protein